MAESTFPLMGGCLCGSVPYIVPGPAESVEHCLCSMCRRVHGVSFLFAAVAAVRCSCSKMKRPISNISRPLLSTAAEVSAFG